MKEIFGYFKFSKKEKEIIDKCKNQNKSEYQKWFYLNLFFPLLIIIGTAVLVYADESYNFNSLVRATFNGGLSLLGINILFSMSSYVIRHKHSKDSDLKSNVVNLSDKLNMYQIPLIIIGSVFYIIQVFKLPENTTTAILLVILVLITLYSSIKIGSILFIIRDDFFMKTYGYEEEINQNVSNLKTATDDLP